MKNNSPQIEKALGVTSTTIAWQKTKNGIRRRETEMKEEQAHYLP